MKTQVLVAAFPLTALVLAGASAEVGAESSGIRGSLHRNVLTSELIHAKDIQRSLEGGNGGGNGGGNEGGNGNNAQKEAQQEAQQEAQEEAQDANEEAQEQEEEAQEEEAAEEYNYDEAWEEVEDMQYADQDTTTTYQSKVEQYEAQAVQLFETAPAEWNAGQWDLLFALFGSILVSCCVLSAFVAYCCIFRDGDDDDVFIKGKRSRRRRHKDDETVTSEYTKDASLLPATTSGSRTFSPRSWVSGTTYGTDDDRSKKSYTAPSATVASPSGTVTSGGFAQVDEGAILHQNTGVTQKSIPHQNTGVTMKSEVGNL